jgi:twitching motility protein PilT
MPGSGPYAQVKNILAEAVTRGAVGLHFSVGNNPVLWVNGEINEVAGQELVTQSFMESFVAELLSAEQKKNLEDNREIVLTHNFDKNLRFKVSVFFQRGFLSATLRFISTIVPTLASLGLNPMLKELVQLNSGLIIVSGSFGSGRSTTVAAIIEEINQTRRKYIITIEDPIEYIFTNQKSIIEQREVGRDTKSFADALNYFQEEDGDALFLEEIRDPEIIPALLEVARSGALVLTTLSASSAANTVSRILDSFKTFDQARIKDLLATALKAVICQKMIPKIGGGNIVVQEIMLVNDAIQSIILNGSAAQIDNIIQTSRKEGMLGFDQQLAELVSQNKITLKDALDNAANRNVLENLAR